jgi:hypothetical protein
VESFTIAGDPDALVRIRVGDLDHLKRVIDRIRRTNGVTGTEDPDRRRLDRPHEPLSAVLTRRAR